MEKTQNKRPVRPGCFVGDFDYKFICSLFPTLKREQFEQGPEASILIVLRRMVSRRKRSARRGEKRRAEEKENNQMAKHGTYASGKDFERAETGEYVVVLKEIKETEYASFNDPNVMEPKWVWIFETTEKKDTDSNGDPYQFRQTTGTSYGGDRANLTKLIDSLFGRHLTEAEWAALDVDRLVGTKFKQMVSLEVNKETKKEYNAIQKTYRGKGKELNIADFLPARAGAAPVPSPQNAGAKELDTPEVSDPFADS